MGHKGVSKRKPKKTNTKITASANVQADNHSLVQALVREKGAPFHRDRIVGPKKTQGKH
jgi:hypothetical protein